VPTAGTKNEFQYCIDSCPHQCMPRAILHTMAAEEKGNEHKGEMISPSVLGGCQRALRLERTEDFWVKPQDSYYAVRGSLIHGFLETQGLKDVYTERRVFKMAPTPPGEPRWWISGRIDYYDRARMALHDYKTMSDKGTYILFNKGAKPEHIWQTNIYAWLLAGGRLETPEGDIQKWLDADGGANAKAIKDGTLTFEDAPGETINWPVSDIQIHHLFMNRVVSTGRKHVEEMYQRDTKRQPFKLETDRQEFVTSRGWQKLLVTLDIPPVPIYTQKRVEGHLIIEGAKTAQTLCDMDYMPPGVIGNKDLDWQCGFCAVKETCMKIEEANSVVRGLGNSVSFVDISQL
jgi:hypothetical protein